MKDAGCTFINYGIESLDQTVLNNMKKGLRPDMIEQGIKDTLKVGISPGLNFIFGKRDNRETITKAVNFLLKYDDFSQKEQSDLLLLIQDHPYITTLLKWALSTKITQQRIFMKKTFKL